MPVNYFVCNLYSQCSFTFHFFHIFQLYNKVILTLLNVGAKSQLERKFCSFPLSHPSYYDYLLFLCKLCDELNKLNQSLCAFIQGIFTYKYHNFKSNVCKLQYNASRAWNISFDQSIRHDMLSYGSPILFLR